MPVAPWVRPGVFPSETANCGEGALPRGWRAIGSYGGA